MNEELTYKVDIVVGDWSGDGHSRETTISFKTNKSADELKKLGNTIFDSIGVDFYSLCEAYEDNVIRGEDYTRLRDIGIFENLTCEDFSLHKDEDEEYIHVGEYSFSTIYMRILQHLDPTFKFERTEKNDSIQIGGYGLFFG